MTSPKTAIAARGEYYNDENGVIIPTTTSNGFQTFGYSINLDYTILEHMVWRIEAKGYTSKDKVFILNNKSSRENYCFTTALAIAF
jgi:Putative beta-barrel porin-2, OmpL-like. bbp2